jgi:F-type H+-transporting ATPase subunit beta
LTALTVAEYFRDDYGNGYSSICRLIFSRFIQAGGSIGIARTYASAVGYQPTLATELGILEERIASTDKAHHFGASRFVPADDLTDPAPANTFTHVDSRRCCRRNF